VLDRLGTHALIHRRDRFWGVEERPKPVV